MVYRALTFQRLIDYYGTTESKQAPMENRVSGPAPMTLGQHARRTCDIERSAAQLQHQGDQSMLDTNEIVLSSTTVQSRLQVTPSFLILSSHLRDPASHDFALPVPKRHQLIVTSHDIWKQKLNNTRRRGKSRRASGFA